MSSKASGTYLAQTHLLACCLLLLLTLPRLPLASLTRDALLAFPALAFLMLTLLPLLSFALLALALLPLPPHSLLEFERHEIFGVTWQLGEGFVIVLPDVGE